MFQIFKFSNFQIFKLPMDISNLIPHIEALIFASDRPLTAMDLTELINNAFGFMEDKITMEQIQTGIDGIVEKYQSEFYPFEMRESGGGWQFLTKKDYHKTVAQLNGEKFLKRLSTAALETLAIIAYKQPITKADIESIRGVNSDYSIQKLLEKELIVITGRNEEMPGKPLVYATSKSFMDYFGINSPHDLPKLKEIYDEAMIQPTVMHEESNPEKLSDEKDISSETSDDETSVFAVSENGQLIGEDPDDNLRIDDPEDRRNTDDPNSEREKGPGPDLGD
jgi:segregation and condensation protein B